MVVLMDHQDGEGTAACLCCMLYQLAGTSCGHLIAILTPNGRMAAAIKGFQSRMLHWKPAANMEHMTTGINFSALSYASSVIAGQQRAVGRGCRQHLAQT